MPPVVFSHALNSNQVSEDSAESSKINRLSYKAVASMRIIFQDGSLLDTGSPESRKQFRQERGELVAAVERLGKMVKENTTLAERIRHKFKIKNTTGYSLNALVDYADPFDIIMHLMIGSEGTFGFISEITYNTV